MCDKLKGSTAPPSVQVSHVGECNISGCSRKATKKLLLYSEWDKTIPVCDVHYKDAHPSRKMECQSCRTPLSHDKEREVYYCPKCGRVA